MARRVCGAPEAEDASGLSLHSRARGSQTGTAGSALAGGLTEGAAGVQSPCLTPGVFLPGPVRTCAPMDSDSHARLPLRDCPWGVRLLLPTTVRAVGLCPAWRAV